MTVCVRVHDGRLMRLRAFSPPVPFKLLPPSSCRVQCLDQRPIRRLVDFSRAMPFLRSDVRSPTVSEDASMQPHQELLGRAPHRSLMREILEALLGWSVGRRSLCRGSVIEQKVVLHEGSLWCGGGERGARVLGVFEGAQGCWYGRWGGHFGWAVVQHVEQHVERHGDGSAQEWEGSGLHGDTRHALILSYGSCSIFPAKQSNESRDASPVSAQRPQINQLLSIATSIGLHICR